MEACQTKPTPNGVLCEHNPETSVVVASLVPLDHWTYKSVAVAGCLNFISEH